MLTLVMRIIGSRFQHSARNVPPDRVSANRVRCFARTQISSEEPVRDNRRALRRHAFVVISKRSKPRPMLLPRVGHDVDQFAAIAQIAQFFERKK